MIDNFQIYFQPGKASNSDIKSLSLKYYDFDIPHACYRSKIVLEKGGNKYKIKEYCGSVAPVLNKISAVNFNKYEQEDIDYDADYYLIRFGDNKIETNDKTKIQEILTMFRFDSILAKDLDEYKLCD